MTITFKQLNATHSQMVCSNDIIMEMVEKFERFVPNYKYNPKFKRGIWDGKIRYIARNGRFLTGLLKDIWLECNKSGYNEFKFDGYTKTSEYEEKSILERLYEFRLPFKLKDYQVSCIVEALTKKRRLFLSATSSGKSSMIYSVSRILAEDGKKILLVVPSVDLVNQMYSDFQTYSEEDDNYSVEDFCHKVYSGQKKYSDKSIIISTWQSIAAISDKTELSEYMKQFDVIIADEVHQAEAKVLSAQLELATNAWYRFGFTGTIKDGTKSLKETLIGLFGKVSEVISARELINRGDATDIKIKALVLNYPEEFCKLNASIAKLNKQIPQAKYQKELDAVIGYGDRNKLISKMCSKLNGNTLIIIRYVEKHGKILEEYLSQNLDKKVYLIHAETAVDIRADIRKELETIDNAILIGSYGLVSTGISIKNLHNLIFASPSKSKIRILQSIGRLLRLHDSKDCATLIDIVDNLSYKDYTNYLMDHFRERYGYYVNEGHPVDIKEINFE